MIQPKPKYKKIDPVMVALCEKHHKDPESVLEILRQIQESDGFLSQDKLTDVGRVLNVPAKDIHGIATFYSMLTLIPRKGVIRVCDGPVCWLCGANEIKNNLDKVSENNNSWNIERTSCLGLCDRAPAILINADQAGPIHPYQTNQLINGFRGQATTYYKPRVGEKRVMLSKAGIIDPDSIESALSNNGYHALESALAQNPETILGIVEASGHTGRGGAGFPVGRKWRFVAQAMSTPKYIICNADESEPLIYKDRVLIDTNPHQILEGMAIAGYATGANQGYIYIRGEYNLQAERLENAIKQAEAVGLLGNDIQGSHFSFHIHVHRGAGAYICGEETALIESLEGKRGEPRLRPPYPPTYGYHGYPTDVNNVESFAAIPAIITNGAEWYRNLSTSAIPGTKIYMLLGHVNQPGLFEAPFGLTLRQIINEFGGGMRSGKKFKFALTGGAAGTIVPTSLLDVPIDYTSGTKGVSLGAGAFLICDKSVSVVAFLCNLLNFFVNESCGKCTPCRVGTQRSFEILYKMDNGQGNNNEINELHALTDNMYDASFCAFGQSVPIPIKSALNHFAGEFNIQGKGSY
jgi:NADH:ubiquinone oxidoreductase subunit F (NADH-binding)/NADH:ubiquinone oxidoreductase subunit E